MLMCCSVQVLGQKESNIWYFGNYSGIDFNTGAPQPIFNGAMATYDNTSTICDSLGNLLFYTNGVTVWNSGHAIMNNGQNIGGSTTGGQSAIIIKQPSSNSLYYIFTSDAFGASGGLKYSVVDMNSAAGLGSVTQIGVVLQNPSTEKLAGYYFCSERYAWLITHKGNSNEFYCYKIGANGLNTVPVVSAVGTYHLVGPWGVVNNSAGQMSISKDGSKISTVKFSNGEIEIFDFNKNTGVVSNPILLSSTYPFAWGVEFSPDASKLYVSIYNSTMIKQFDISSGNPNIINNSMIGIGNITGAFCSGLAGSTGYCQRGPDDKIYIAKCGSNYISVINSPNSAGALCGFVDNGVFLGSGVSTFGLSRSVASECLTSYLQNNESDESFSVYPNPGNGSFTFSFPVKSSEKIYQLIIYNSLGKIVFSKQIDSFQIKSINTALLSGYYTLELKGNNKSIYKKIVVY